MIIPQVFNLLIYGSKMEQKDDSLFAVSFQHREHRGHGEGYFLKTRITINLP